MNPPSLIEVFIKILRSVMTNTPVELPEDIDQYIEALMNSYYDNIKGDKTDTRIKELEKEQSK